ncbi:hypothetical protein C0J52_10590 [Blattella germanica]|nr:hypothetical protein C0J52_10590 [Blattella germanica]
MMDSEVSVLNKAAESAIPNRRQVLPPIPGYIPVYIQHGDVPPEDPHEYAGIFQVADNIAPPRVSPTMDFPTTTTEMSSDSSTETPATSIASVESQKAVTSNAIPETTSGSKDESISESTDKIDESTTHDALGDEEKHKLNVGDIEVSKSDTLEKVEETKSDNIEPNKQSEAEAVGNMNQKSQMRFIEWKIINPTF